MNWFIKVRGSPHLKTIVWFLSVVVVLMLFAVLHPIYLGLFERLQRAENVESALHLIEKRKSEPGVLTWLPDAANLPRRMEPFNRDAITNDYLLAFEEISFAQRTGDTTGLRSYFVEGALDDVKLSTTVGSSVQSVGWDRQLKLTFYSPDGATIAFTEKAWFAETTDLKNFDATETNLERRTMDVVMQLDDGNWRIHHWQVTAINTLADQFLDNKQKPINQQWLNRLSNVRGVRYIGKAVSSEEFWEHYAADVMQSDVALVQQIGFNTIGVEAPEQMSAANYFHFKDLLRQSAEHGLSVMVYVSTKNLDNSLLYIPALFKKIKPWLSLFSHPAVIAVVLAGPAGQQKGASRFLLPPFLKYFALWLRAETHKPISALGEQEKPLADNLDFVSLRYFNSRQPIGQQIEQEKTFGHPVRMVETGTHSQFNGLFDFHTENDQARFFASLIPITQQQHLGYMVSALYDIPDQSKTLGEKGMGLVRQNGFIKPAVRIFNGGPSPARSLDEYLMQLKILLLVFVGLVILVLAGYGIKILRKSN